MVGLLIELLGILALGLWTRTDQTGAPLPGSFTSRQVWIAVGIGFVIWLVGSVLSYWPDPPGLVPRTGGPDQTKPERD
jgi:hypothetical protein